MWGRTAGTELRQPFHDLLWGCAHGRGEALERLLPLPSEGKLISVIRKV